MAKKARVSNGITWPADRKTLYAAGWANQFGKVRPCKLCKTPIEFWKNADGNFVPLEQNPEDKKTLLNHFFTCPHAGEFRKEKDRPIPAQTELFK